MVIAKKDTADHLIEVINMLKSGGNNLPRFLMPFLTS